MKRKLTPREWALLAVLTAVAAASGYLMLFRAPMLRQRDEMRRETALCLEQLDVARQRAEEKRRMERELEELFAGGDGPLGLSPYDNSQAVMVELNRVLAAAKDYSLAFSTPDESDAVVRRSVSFSFTAPDYAAARAILQELHDSSYRCLLGDLSVSVGHGSGSITSVTGTVVFFEYRAEEQ